MNATRSQSNWKLMANGLLVSRDESEVVGTFRAARNLPWGRQEEVRGLICNAENVRNMLARIVTVPSVPAELAAQAAELLSRVRPRGASEAGKPCKHGADGTPVCATCARKRKQVADRYRHLKATVVVRGGAKPAKTLHGWGAR